MPAEPIIHVIPEAYWGGKGPKVARRVSVAPLQARKLSPRALFWILISGTFLIVVGISAWYFTLPLRAPGPASQPVVEVPTPPTESAPIEAPVPTEEEPELSAVMIPEPAEQIPEVPSPLEDTDRDGLSNAEETLYHSGQTQPDTDQDGFLDGHEVVNLYNPSGNAPERLEDAGLAQRFVNQEGGYRILIPVGWTAQTTVANRTVSIVDQQGQAVFEININDNPQGVGLEEWYRNLSESGQARATLLTSNKSGLSGILSDNRIAGYFAKGNLVFGIKYSSGSSPGPYQTTFEMMLNSFGIMN